MDIEVLPDSYLLTIASAYVRQISPDAYEFSDLAIESPDIYHLVYHPTYEKLTKPQRQTSGATLDDILFACLNHADLDYNEELANNAKFKLAKERVKAIKIRR